MQRPLLLLVCLLLAISTTYAFHSLPSLLSSSPKTLSPLTTLTTLAAVGPGGGDLERMKRLKQIKKLKDTGGDYNKLLDGTEDASNAASAYADDNGEGGGDDIFSSKDYTDEDRELYGVLLSQEKQALVNKILKAKERQQPSSPLSSPAPPNKGAPSPYLSRKIEQDMTQQAINPEAAAAGAPFGGAETYQPQSVSWGKYARPKNIPEAFGGGKPIPEGGIKLDGDEEWKLKYENLMSEVREYKKEVQGTELTPLEKMDEEKIHAARAAARRFMLRGEYEAARDVLVPLRNTCSVRSALGAMTLMDLAVAYESTYEFDKAQELYTLLRSSPVRELRSKAKALNLGAEAMKKLGLGSKSNVNPRNMVNFAYIPSQLEGSYGLYMKSKGGIDLADEPERPIVQTVAEALEVLEDAVIAQGVGVRFDAINAALRAIYLDAIRRDDPSGGPSRSLGPMPLAELQGRWRCRLTSYQESVDFLTKVDVWQRLETESKTVTGNMPVSPFEAVRDVKSPFTWDSKARVLNYGAKDSISNALGLPTGLPHTLRVLVVSDTVMVTARGSDVRGTTPKESFEAKFAVWTRAG